MSDFKDIEENVERSLGHIKYPFCANTKCSRHTTMVPDGCSMAREEMTINVLMIEQRAIERKRVVTRSGRNIWL